MKLFERIKTLLSGIRRPSLSRARALASVASGAGVGLSAIAALPSRLRQAGFRSLFEPAVGVLNRLRYPYKFGLIGAVAVLSIGFFVVSLMFIMRGEIADAQAERAGLSAYLPAARLMQLTQQHQALTSGVQAGDAAFATRLQAKRAEIDAAIAGLQIVLARPGMEGASQRLGTISSEWAALVKREAKQPEDAAAFHHAIIGLQADLLRDIGEASHLISDSKPETAFLADALVRKVPALTTALTQLRTSGIPLLASRDMGSEWRKIEPQIAEIERTRDELLDSLARAANAGGPAFAKLQAHYREASATLVPMLEVTDRDIVKGAFDVSPTHFDALVGHAAGAIFAGTGTHIAPLLDEVLAARLESLTARFWRNMAIAAVMTALLTYFAVAMFFAILGSVSELAAGAAEIRDGKLGYRIDFSARDELRAVANQFNSMAESFAGVIREVQSSARELSHSSSALASSAAQVSRGSEKQSEAASTMAAAIEQMTVGIDEISRHATDAETVSNQSGELSVTGGEVVDRTVHEMERIAEAVNDSARVIEELGRNSAQISSIVKSIKEIADQTNLLALNASIEAARAGDSGRGFALVADEVRKLAERTTRATQEISVMVGGIQSGTNRAVATMQEGVSRVRGGVQLTNQAGAAMVSIRDESGRVVRSISDISLALREQSAASTEIARTVEHIARMAEQNSSAVADTAKTAGQLEELSRGLHGEVGRFTL